MILKSQICGGKDLYEHLIAVYKNNSKYCLMLISENYAKKLWTNHERKAAQARAFNENKEYILPLKLDDTEITGILETTGYLDFRKETVESVCLAVETKLWGNFDNDRGLNLIKPQLEAVYNRVMLLLDLVLMPSTHPRLGESCSAMQLYESSIHTFLKLKSDVALNSASFDSLALSQLTIFQKNIEKLYKVIAFLINHLDLKRSNHDFILEIPQTELNETHSFLKKLRVFDSYATRNIKYYQPQEIIENWKLAESECDNLFFTPSEYVFSNERHAYAFDFSCLNKIHCNDGDRIEIFTE